MFKLNIQTFAEDKKTDEVLEDNELQQLEDEVKKLKIEELKMEKLKLQSKLKPSKDVEIETDDKQNNINFEEEVIKELRRREEITNKK